MKITLVTPIILLGILFGCLSDSYLNQLPISSLIFQRCLSCEASSGLSHRLASKPLQQCGMAEILPLHLSVSDEDVLKSPTISMGLVSFLKIPLYLSISQGHLIHTSS